MKKKFLPYLSGDIYFLNITYLAFIPTNTHCLSLQLTDVDSLNFGNIYRKMPPYPTRIYKIPSTAASFLTLYDSGNFPIYILFPKYEFSLELNSRLDLKLSSTIY